jgi:hypothetical protein
MAPTKGNVYGFVYAQLWRLNANGLPVCQLDPDNLVNGSTSHAFLIEGITEGTLPEHTYGTVTFRDGNIVRGSVDNGLEGIGTGSLTLNMLDANLMRLTTGGNLDTTTIVNALIFAANTGQPLPFRIGLMLTFKFFSRDLDTFGSTWYSNIVYPNCSARVIRPNVNQASGENPMTGSLQFTPAAGNKFPVGNAFSSTQGWKNNQEMEYFIVAAHPYSLTVFVNDGTEDTYTLGYLPVSEDVASGNTTNLFGVNGAVTAPTSVDDATGDVVKAAAGSAGQLSHAFYQTEFTPIPA